MGSRERKAANAAAFLAISVFLSIMALPFATPFIIAVMTKSAPQLGLASSFFFSDDLLGNYLALLGAFASGPAGMKALLSYIALFTACMCLIGGIKKLGAPTRETDEGALGDARLIKSRAELRTKNDFWNGKGAPEKAGLVLGSTKRGYYFDSAVPHACVVGATGAGKSVLLAIQTTHLCMAAGWNLIVTGKEELLELTGDKADELGYRRVVLDLRGYPGASRFNMLDAVVDAAEAGDIAETQRAARQIAADLIPIGNEANTYFPRAARSALAACILVVAMEPSIPRAWKNMASVCNLVNAGTAGDDPRDPSAPLKDLMRSLGPAHPAYMAAVDMLSDFGATTAGKNVASTLKEAISIFNDESIRRMTAESDVTIGDMVDKKSIVYMHMLEENDPYLTIFSVFVSQWWRAAQKSARANGGRMPHPTAIVGDEWGNMPKVDALPEMVTLGRSMKLHVYVFIQNLKQINKYSKPGDQNAGRDKLLGSMGTKVALKLSNPEDGEYFTKLCGKRTIRSLNVSKTRQGAGFATSSSETYSERAEDLIRPWEWQSRIPIRDGIIAVKGGENSAPGREGVFAFPAEYAPNTPAGEFFGLGDPVDNILKQTEFHVRQQMLLPATTGGDLAPAWMPKFPTADGGGDAAETAGPDRDIQDDWARWDGDFL